MERDELKFLALLLVFALIARVLPAVFFIEEPNLPHDMQYYVEHARFFEEGKPYDKVQSNGLSVVYGPLSLAFYWGWVKVAGEDFFTLKLMPIIFDLLSVALVYFIAKKAAGGEAAKYTSFFYAFFYLVLLSAGALGNDDHMFMFFLLGGVYLALLGRIMPSGILVGIAAGFKPVPIALAPVIAYYIYRQFGMRKAVAFSAISALLFLAILAPVYIESGQKALVPYTSAVNFEYFGAGGIAPLNLARLAAAGIENAVYIAQHGQFMPFEQNSLKTTNRTWINDAFSLLSKPLFYLSFLLFFAYAFFFRINDAGVELARNLAFLVFFSLLFSKVLMELLFLYALPFLLVLLVALEKKRFGEFKLERADVLGVAMLFMAVLIFSLFYREKTPGFFGSAIMLAFVLLAASGTYFAFRKSSLALPLAAFVLGCALFSVYSASPLFILQDSLFFAPNIPFGVETTHSYIVKTANLALSSLLAIIGSVLILLGLHRLCYQQIPS